MRTSKAYVFWLAVLVVTSGLIGCTAIRSAQIRQRLSQSIQQNLPPNWDLIYQSSTKAQEPIWVFRASGAGGLGDFAEAGAIAASIAEQAGYVQSTSEGSFELGVFANRARRSFSYSSVVFRQGDAWLSIIVAYPQDDETMQFVAFALCPCGPTEIDFDWS